MKLVLCSDNSVRRNVRGVGGVGNHVYELSQALAKLGNDVTILAKSDSSWRFEGRDGLEIIGVSSIELKGLGSVSYGRALYKKLRFMVKQELIDAIQFHNITGLVPYLHRNDLPIPTWTKCHGINDPHAANLNLTGRTKIASFMMDSTISWLFSNLCYRMSPHIIANSKCTKERLADSYRVDPRKISVVYNGVNHEIFNTTANSDNLRAKLHLGGSTVILFVGDFSFLKGIFHLILSHKRVVNEIPAVTLVLVGGYSETSRQEVEKLVRTLGLGLRIKVESYVPHRELPKYYIAADICVVPSLCEPFGNVALEAMACGKPVIAFHTGGLAEIVNSEVGITVRPERVDSLAKAIIYLVKNEELRAKMGRKAAEYSKSFSWDRAARETLKVLDRLKKQ